MGHIIDFRNAETLDDLVNFIGLDKDLLQKAISPENTSTLYKKHKIPKKNKKLQNQRREVWEVINPNLANAYKALTRRFEAFIRDIDENYPHPNSYGYSKKKNILFNAQNHCGAKLILRADIQNFSPLYLLTDLKKFL